MIVVAADGCRNRPIVQCGGANSTPLRGPRRPDYYPIWYRLRDESVRLRVRLGTEVEDLEQLVRALLRLGIPK